MNANESLACSGVAMDVRQGFLNNPEYGHFEILRKSH